MISSTNSKDNSSFQSDFKSSGNLNSISDNVGKLLCGSCGSGVGSASVVGWRAFERLGNGGSIGDNSRCGFLTKSGVGGASSNDASNRTGVGGASRQPRGIGGDGCGIEVFNAADVVADAAAAVDAKDGDGDGDGRHNNGAVDTEVIVVFVACNVAVDPRDLLAAIARRRPGH